MTVAFDSSGSSAGTSTTNFSWTHTPTGTPRGVICFISQEGAGDQVSGVTYGGVAMTRIAGNDKSAAEAGAVYCYFLGSGITAGAQIVAVTVTGANAKAGTSFAVTASTDTEVVSSDTSINSDSQADPTVTLALSGRSCFVSLGLFSGQANVSGITPLTGWTSTSENDFGTDTAARYGYNTIDSADVSVGWTQTADDAIMIAAAVTEKLGQDIISAVIINNQNVLARQAAIVASIQRSRPVWVS